MKISRTFIILIITALILFAGALYSAKTAQKLKNDEAIRHKEEIKRKSEYPQLWVSHGDVADGNYIDYIVIAAGLFILATSTTVAAVWIKKAEN
jgi:hypothetical protein